MSYTSVFQTLYSCIHKVAKKVTDSIILPKTFISIVFIVIVTEDRARTRYLNVLLCTMYMKIPTKVYF